MQQSQLFTKTNVLLLLFFVSLALASWASGQSLWGIDWSPLKLEAQGQLIRTQGFSGWHTWTWFGGGYLFNPSRYNLLAAFGPRGQAFNFLVISSIAISVFGAIWLGRVLKLNAAGQALMAASFGFSNVLFGFIATAHANKIDAMAYIPVLLAIWILAVQTRHWKWFLLGGCVLGLMFLCDEPQMVAYTCGLYVLALIALRFSSLIQASRTRQAGEFIRNHWKDDLKVVAFSGIMFVIAFVFAIQAFQQYLDILKLQSSKFGVQKLPKEETTPAPASTDSPASSKPATPSAPDSTAAIERARAWIFATAWSMPPEETLTALFTARLFGDRSGGGSAVSGHVYWGRLPYKVQEDYLGVLPLFFALVSICYVRRSITWLFLGTAILCLLIAWGKYFPLYQFLFELPTMKAQRNPNRWYYFVFLSITVLSGIGISWFFDQLRWNDIKKRIPEHLGSFRKLCGALFWMAVILFAGGLLLEVTSLSMAKSIVSTAPADQQSAQYLSLTHVRVQDAAFALWRTGLFGILALGGILAVFRNPSAPWVSSRNFLLLLIAITVIDLGSNLRRFMTFIPWKHLITPDPLAQRLLDDPNEPFRVRILGEHSGYLALNNYVFQSFPVWGIELGQDQLSLRQGGPEDFLTRWAAAGLMSGEKYMQLLGIRYVIAPELFLKYVSFIKSKVPDPSRVDLQKLGASLGVADVGLLGNMLNFLLHHDDPARFQLVHTHNEISLLRYLQEAPRARLVRKFEVIKGDYESIFQRISQKDFNLMESVVLMENPKQNYSTGNAPLPVPVVSQYQPAGTTILRTEAAEPTLLVYGSSIPVKAFIDGKEAGVLNANYSNLAIELPEGSHEVKLVAAPNRPKSVIITLSCLGIFLAVMAMLLIREIGRSAGQKPAGKSS